MSTRSDLVDALTSAQTLLAEGNATYKQYVSDGTWDELTEAQQSAGLAILKKREILVEIAQDNLDAFDSNMTAFTTIREAARATLQAEQAAANAVFSSEWQDKENYLTQLNNNGAELDWNFSLYQPDWAEYLAANTSEIDLSNYTSDWASV